MLRCVLVARKENLTDVPTGLTGWSKNLDPTGNPTDRSTRSELFDPTGFHFWNICKNFFRILNKHFPKHSPFHKLFNRNNVKLSYSCTPSVSSIISSLKRELLQEKPTPSMPPTLCILCNCRKNTICPSNGECSSKSLVCTAELICANVTKYYGI